MLARVSAAAVLGAVAVAVAGLLATPGASAADETYTIATDISNAAPFEYMGDGALVGIDIDLINAIAEDQGFGIRLAPMEFDPSLDALRTGRVDGLISAVIITEERKKEFAFSEPYFESGVQLAVAADDGHIDSYDDLRGTRVAVLKGTDAAAFAESIKQRYGFAIDYFDYIRSVQGAVIDGAAQAYFDDFATVNFDIARGADFKTVGAKGDTYELGFAVAKGGNAELLHKFNAGLASLRESGRYDEIIATYQGPRTNTTVVGSIGELIGKIVEAALVPILLAAVVLLWWSGRRVGRVIGWFAERRRRRAEPSPDDPEARIRALEPPPSGC